MSAPSAILLGSKPGSVVALQTMLSRGWSIPVVVASGDDRKDWLPPPNLADHAAANGIHVCNQSDIPEGTRADFVISYMYRYRVKTRALGMATRAALNFHAAPLPRFGGWAFYNVAILEQASEYGVTCHHMDEGFDTGPILKMRMFQIDPSSETAVSLERRAQKEMIKLFCEFCELAESGLALPKEPQQRELMRYMTATEFKALKAIPTNADADTIERHARAFWYPPYDCAQVSTGRASANVVPRIALESIAKHLHSADYEELRLAAGNFI